MKNKSLLIKNGSIVSSSGITKADIFILNENLLVILIVSEANPPSSLTAIATIPVFTFASNDNLYILFNVKSDVKCLELFK